MQFAEQLGVSQQSVTAYESGQRRAPISHLLRLAALLGTSMKSLLGEQSKPSECSPAPKLHQQVGRVSQLPKARQRMVSEVIDSLLAQAGR